MKYLLVLIVLLLAFETYGKTQNSQLVDYIQNKYASKFSKYPILIFDYDELEYRFTLERAFGKSREKEIIRSKIIQKYVFEKVGVVLTDTEADTFELYMTRLRNGAFAVPILSGSFGQRTFKMCGVFSASTNSNKRQETQRIVAMGEREAYGDISYDNLKSTLTFEQLKLFSLYHELSHCMDPEFLPSTYNSYGSNVHDIHLSESFAETMGLFFLEREGITNVAKQRAMLRSLYSRKMGKWAVENPQNGMGEESFKYGGVIYYLAPVLLAADELLDQDKDFIHNDIDVLRSKAVEIVKDHAFVSRSMRAVLQILDVGEEEALKEYEELYHDMPDFFARTMIQMKNYISQSKELMNEILGVTKDPQLDNSEALNINYQEACDYLANDEKDNLFQILEMAREDLKQAQYSDEKQKSRQDELNNFFPKLAEECSN